MTDYVPFYASDISDAVRRYNDWLEDVTYRPGWKLEIRQHDFHHPYLQVKAPVEDSYRPGVEIIVTHTSPMWPDITDRSTFLHWLRDALYRIEVHESAEWLRWSTGAEAGRPIFDPHQERDRSHG